MLYFYGLAPSASCQTPSIITPSPCRPVDLHAPDDVALSRYWRTTCAEGTLANHTSVYELCRVCQPGQCAVRCGRGESRLREYHCVMLGIKLWE
jgi:hypothetical protein